MNNISQYVLSSKITTQANDFYDLNKNKLGNETNDDFSSLDSKLNSFEEKILICIFLIVIILGFVGNILVILVILLNKNMRTSNNLFILNLSISDLTLCVFSIPINVYKTLRHTWIFGVIISFKTFLSFILDQFIFFYFFFLKRLCFARYFI